MNTVLLSSTLLLFRNMEDNNTIVFIGKQVLLDGELRAARLVVKDGKIVEVVEAEDGEQVISVNVLNMIILLHEHDCSI